MSHINIILTIWPKPPCPELRLCVNTGNQRRRQSPDNMKKAQNGFWMDSLIVQIVLDTVYQARAKRGLFTN